MILFDKIFKFFLDRASEEYNPISPINGHVLIFSNGSLLLNSVTSLDEGNYRCTAENGIGPVLYKNIAISVNGNLI